MINGVVIVLLACGFQDDPKTRLQQQNVYISDAAILFTFLMAS